MAAKAAAANAAAATRDATQQTAKARLRHDAAVPRASEGHDSKCRYGVELPYQKDRLSDLKKIAPSNKWSIKN